jgi:hypothetical protein
MAAAAASATWGRKMVPYCVSVKPWRERSTALLAAKLTIMTPWTTPEA